MASWKISGSGLKVIFVPVRLSGATPMSLTSLVGLAALVFLLIDLAVAAHLGLGPFAQGGDSLGADAVQARRKFCRCRLSNLAPAPTVVSTTSSVDLPPWDASSTGMPRPSSLTLRLPSTLILTWMFLQIAGEGFIDAVVNQLVDQMVQALGAGVADVHAGPLADVGGIAEDIDVVAFIVAAAIGHRGSFLHSYRQILSGCG